MPNPSCYLCQKHSEFIHQIKNRKIYYCKNDDLFFAIEDKNTRQHYDRDYYESSPYDQLQFFNQVYFQDKLKEIKTLISDAEFNILDVGCGWGNFLQVLKNNHLSYLGIDLSPEAIKICREKNLNCQEADLINFNKIKSKKYSAITFFQVIEHIKNPLEYLKSAKKLLKKDGVLLITTPNQKSPLRLLFGSHWSVFKTPSHHFFYSKKSLEHLLRAAGFKNFTIKIDRFRFFPLKYILQQIFKSQLQIPRIINFPIPTDPWGDLEVIIINK